MPPNRPTISKNIEYLKRAQSGIIIVIDLNDIHLVYNHATYICPCNIKKYLPGERAQSGITEISILWHFT